MDTLQLIFRLAVLLSSKIFEAPHLAAAGLVLHEIFLLNHVKCDRIVYARKVRMPLCNPVNRLWRQPGMALHRGALVSQILIRNLSTSTFRYTELIQTFPKTIRWGHVQRQYSTLTYQAIHDSSDGPCVSKICLEICKVFLSLQNK